MSTFVLLTFIVVWISAINGENYCDSGLNVPNNSTDPNDCCPTPAFLPMDIVTYCRDTYLEMQKKKNNLPGLPRGCCLGDCMLERMGFNPKGDGNIDLKGLKEYIMNMTNNQPIWAETMAKSINTCYAMAESRADEFKTGYEHKPSFEGEKMCHPISGRVLSCMTNERFINCPSSVWKTSENCVAIKTFVEKCEVPHKQS
ncbi:general odorant-binding protein 66-like [Culicoides brevitarsis]|uniref:general odorant-binding protein 66-like n=1 Tax=Culicoides brevitarsis TaxID=469753 RepID=UPI00307B8D26